ncbi:MAG: aldo/keto reductase [Planctomycetota bacterium]|nr:aldo/keto reductase [Planctomycetota bacterium]
MKFAPLPGTTLQASRIALGTAWFGTAIPEEKAFELLDAYFAAGGNFLDSAHMYASWVKGGAGKSETTVGQWIAKHGRKGVVIATKGADLGMTRAGIRAQLDESLARLKLPSIDFYWLHRDDPAVPVGEIIDWLNELVAEGRFPAFGCSNWSPTRIAQAQVYAATAVKRGFSASQIGWSLGRVNPEAAASAGGQRFMDDETMAYHRGSKLAQVAYSSQAGGFFAGNYDPAGAPPGVTPNAAIVKFYGTPANYARLKLCNQLAKAKGCSANQVSLAYLLHHSFPSFAIAGANSVERMADTCGSADVELTSDEVERLESPAVA